MSEMEIKLYSCSISVVGKDTKEFNKAVKKFKKSFPKLAEVGSGTDLSSGNRDYTFMLKDKYSSDDAIKSVKIDLLKKIKNFINDKKLEYKGLDGIYPRFYDDGFCKFRDDCSIKEFDGNFIYFNETPSVATYHELSVYDLAEILDYLKLYFMTLKM